MTDKEWDIIHDVHVKGAYACTKAAWPIMRKQKFGRIINVSPGLLKCYSRSPVRGNGAEGCRFLADRLRRRYLRQLRAGQVRRPSPTPDDRALY